MTAAQHRRGCAPVGYVAELDRIEAASVIYLRLWSESAETRSQVWNDLATGLGRDHARKAIQSFEQLCSLCVKHGRRPLMCHSVQCKCLGADESCFANFIATASEGERAERGALGQRHHQSARGAAWASGVARRLHHDPGAASGERG